jgi:hypothetical protein
MEDIRKGRCPLCAHHEIVEGPVLDLSPRTAHWVGSQFSATEQGAFPAGFAYAAGKSPGEVAVYGSLVRYACRECGYTQTFVSAPKTIPIGREYGTRLLSTAPSDPSGPYR